MNSEIVQPSVNLLESMRSMGYSLEAAVADLIDNSITAGARRVSIDADVVEGKYIAILDNGCGMTSATAKEALRFAGSVGQRTATDLGRFGLGLKTASLSQARCLTVISKKNDSVIALRWDVDFVIESGQWLLNILTEADLMDMPLKGEFDKLATGTLVLWSDLDLLIGDSDDPGLFLSERLGSLRSNLALVFHRFLSDNREKLNIEVNGIDLKPIDPFLSSNPKTQRTAIETLRISDAEVYVEGFTLPHPSGLTQVERRRTDLAEGMRDAQGFYVYRNRRLISHGHWFGLARKTELSKQTRVKVDVPAALDSLWHLDIKKSRSEPPPSFKARLRHLIDPLLERGHRVHTFRGRREHTSVSHIWNKLKTREGFRYEVNLDSPLVKAVLSRLNPDEADRVVGLLQTVTSTFPIMDAYVEVAANGQAISSQPDSAALIDRLTDIHRSGILSADAETALTQLFDVEPFNKVDDLRLYVDIVWRRTQVDE